MIRKIVTVKQMSWSPGEDAMMPRPLSPCAHSETAPRRRPAKIGPPQKQLETNVLYIEPAECWYTPHSVPNSRFLSQNPCNRHKLVVSNVTPLKLAFVSFEECYSKNTYIYNTDFKHMSTSCWNTAREAPTSLEPTGAAPHMDPSTASVSARPPAPLWPEQGCYRYETQCYTQKSNFQWTWHPHSQEKM